MGEKSKYYARILGAPSMIFEKNVNSHRKIFMGADERALKRQSNGQAESRQIEFLLPPFFSSVEDL